MSRLVKKAAARVIKIECHVENTVDEVYDCCFLTTEATCYVNNAVNVLMILELLGIMIYLLLKK